MIVYASGDDVWVGFKDDGIVVMWGDFFVGGDSSVIVGELVDVAIIVFIDGVFVVLIIGGKVVVWGGVYNNVIMFSVL